MSNNYYQYKIAFLTFFKVENYNIFSVFLFRVIFIFIMLNYCLKILINLYSSYKIVQIKQVIYSSI